MRRSSFYFRIRLAASVFDVGEVIVLASSEDGWADCDLRGVAWPVDAVAEGRYGLLLQAHISKRGDGCFACDLR